MDVEPALANLCERALDYLLKTADPTLLACVELYLGDTWSLNLFEFFNTKSFTFNGNIVYPVIWKQLIALVTNLNHGFITSSLMKRELKQKLENCSGKSC